MRILIAEDDKVTRMRLEKVLGQWGFEVESFADGASAWARLCEPDAPRLCIIDWLMPGIEGPAFCRRVRDRFPEEYFYLIILSAQQGVENLAVGLGAGADDYVTKPFVGREFRSRIDVGVRVLGLERMLAKKVQQLEKALEGKSTGEQLQVVVQPEEGYGPVDPELVKLLPHDAFEGIDEVKPGMQFQAESPDGQMQIILVKDVAEEGVTIDANHPLAGQVLHFDVTIAEVREATAEEIEHEHVH